MCTGLFEGRENQLFVSTPYSADRLPPPRRLTNALRIAVFSDVEFVVQTSGRLAALRASLGDDRFAMLWVSKEEPATEFARREGRSLAAYLSEQMRSPTATYQVSSLPRGAQVWLVLALVGLFTTLAIIKSPREYRP
jgi:hypothetical protein